MVDVGADLLSDLMLQYALEGLHDWKQNTDEEVRNQARKLLSHRIFSNDGELRSGMAQPRPDKFFPIPRFGYKSEILFCCFLPRAQQPGVLDRFSFVLFLMLKNDNSLVFRFEPAEESGYRHNYPHVQLCQNVIGMNPPPMGVPTFIPERDPAFPLPSSNPLKLFLSMATAVHGRSGGVEKLIRTIFAKGSAVSASQKYFKALNEMLDD